MELFLDEEVASAKIQTALYEITELCQEFSFFSSTAVVFRSFFLASGRLRASTGVWREDVVVLGVETSCDDTGVAVIGGDGHVMGEALQSQTEVHKM